MFKNKDGLVRSGWKILGVVVLFNLITYFSFLPISKIAHSLAVHIGAFTPSGDVTESFYNAYFSVAMIIQEMIMIAVPLFFWRILQKKTLSEMGFPSLKIKENKKDFAVGLLWGFLSFTFVFAGILLSSSGQVTSHGVSVNKDTFLYLIVFIMVGFAEEILGRGYIMSVLKQTKSIPAAVIVSGILFSLLHSANSGISLLAFVNIFLVGVFLAFLFIKTGTIWTGIGFHIMWNYSQGNIYGFLVSGIPVKGIITTEISSPNAFNGGAFGPEGGIFVTLITLVSILLVFLIYKKRDIPFMEKI